MFLVSDPFTSPSGLHVECLGSFLQVQLHVHPSGHRLSGRGAGRRSKLPHGALGEADDAVSACVSHPALERLLAERT